MGVAGPFDRSLHLGRAPSPWQKAGYGLEHSAAMTDSKQHARVDITEPVEDLPDDLGSVEASQNKCSLGWVCGQLGSLLGVAIASIIGAVVYAMFLQAILWQSLVLPGGVVDPADWKTKLSGTAWGLGAFTFFGLAASSAAIVAFPLPLQPGSSSAWFISGFLLALLVIQLATVRYASLRPELCKVTKSDAFFFFCRVPSWWPACCASRPVFRRRLSVRRISQPGLPDEAEDVDLAGSGETPHGSASSSSMAADRPSKASATSRPMVNGKPVRVRRTPSAPSVPLSHTRMTEGAWGYGGEVRPASGLGAAIISVVFGGRVSNVFVPTHGARPVPVTAERASVIAAHLSAASVHSGGTTGGGSFYNDVSEAPSQNEWVRSRTRTPGPADSSGQRTPSGTPGRRTPLGAPGRPPPHPDQPSFESSVGPAGPSSASRHGDPFVAGPSGAGFATVMGRSAMRRSMTLGSLPVERRSSGMGSLMDEEEGGDGPVGAGVQSASGVPRMQPTPGGRRPASKAKRQRPHAGARRPAGGRTSPLPSRRYLCRSSMDLGSWRNYVQIFVIVVELLQLASLALGTDTRSTGRIRRVIPDNVLSTFSAVRGVLWQGSGIGLSHARRVDIAYAVVRGFGILYALLCGVFIALDLMASSWLAPFLFSLLAGAAYVTVTSGTLFVIYASQDPGQVAVCCLVLLFYSSTAVFVSIYRGDATAAGGFDEARIRPRFLAVERVLKGVLAVSFAVLGSEPAVRAWVVAAILVVYAVLFLVAAPCNVVVLNVVRSGTIAVSAWCAVISALALTVEPPLEDPLSEAASEALSLALVWGSVAIGGVTLLLTNWAVVDALDAASCGCFKCLVPCFRHRRGATASAMKRAARVAPMPADAGAPRAEAENNA